MEQTHSCLQPVQDSFAHRPQSTQRKYLQQLACVLGQSPMSHLTVAKLALDHSKGTLDFGADAGVGFSNYSRSALNDLLLSMALLDGVSWQRASPHSDAANESRHAFEHPVARVGKDHFFLAMQQYVCLRDVMGVGRHAFHRVRQARVHIQVNVCLHAKVPFIALLGLALLWITLTPIVQQVAKAQDRALVAQSVDVGLQMRKLLVLQDVVHGLCRSQVGVTKKLLQQMNAQNHFCGTRWPPCFARRRMWRNQCQQRSLGGNQVHFVQKNTLARVLGGQLESSVGKAHLFHGSSASDQAVKWLTFAELP